MSWQKYMYQYILKENPDCRLAVIASAVTGEVEAKFENGLPSEITRVEVKIICDQMGSPNLMEQFRFFGINIGGEKYACQQIRPRAVYGMIASTKIAICASNKYIVIAAGKGDNIDLSVQNLVQYLKYMDL